MWQRRGVSLVSVVLTVLWTTIFTLSALIAAEPEVATTEPPASTAEVPTIPLKPIVAAPAATAPAVLVPREGAKLQELVRQTLIKVAGQKTELSESDVRELLGLYGEVQRDKSLSRTEREKLRHDLRWRLLQVSAAIQRGELHVPPTVATPPQNQVLAQQSTPPAFGALTTAGPPSSPPADENHGRELVELIEDTVAPSTWESRGGTGVIRYWPLGQAIVVRQTGDAHHDLAELLEALRH